MARGESFRTAAQIQRIQRYREIEARWSPRTEWEREGLRRMAEGLSHQEIARELGLPPGRWIFTRGTSCRSWGWFHG